MQRRNELVTGLARRIADIGGAGTTRVGVDGVDGAGKTVFADELGAALAALGRPVIRAGTDAFHNPRAVRHRRGRDSPEGFFRDSFDYSRLRALLLDPLSPGGTGHFRRAAFDHETDSPVDAPVEVAPTGAVLVFDGIFVHRPELLPYWDFSIFLRVGFDISIPRLAGRIGCSAHPDSTDPNSAGNRRYVEGQRRYLAECQPEHKATVVVDNTDLAAPVEVPAKPGMDRPRTV
ncbi:MAG TPA: uridine kinase [Actinophytocola sp.]|uniref:uridine kinase n=1 Tax=Actinophytocola sp. TaxID=1872138 RepID=UPI002DBE2C62|nr:uridine kinase [Actinophytocola sp.]HEU5470344.1 uridine kinase [Actinophytocola sp.]